LVDKPSKEVMMKNNDNLWLHSFIFEYLEQVNYWYERFELSQEIGHLNNAERHAKVVRAYLPKCFQKLSIIGLCNLYLSLLSISNSNKSGD
jgi:hypothetical protein